MTILPDFLKHSQGWGYSLEVEHIPTTRSIVNPWASSYLMIFSRESRSCGYWSWKAWPLKMLLCAEKFGYYQRGCCGLNVKWPPQTWAFECLIWSWWSNLGRSWNLPEVEPSWRKWVLRSKSWGFIAQLHSLMPWLSMWCDQPAWHSCCHAFPNTSLQTLSQDRPSLPENASLVLCHSNQENNKCETNIHDWWV